MHVGRWLAWIAYFCAWTFLLVTPYPVQASQQVLPAEFHFPLSKLLHIAGYSLFAVLSGWLRLDGSHRWLLLGFMMLHAGATEIIQLWVPGRHGSFSDVGLDWVGIGIGVAITWPWWRPVVAAENRA